jgi:hypothetical protein
MDKELNCIVGLVEVLNFNEKYPENHTFCTTALNDKYISTMNSETLIIEKQRKKDFFDKILVEGIKKMKLLYDKLKSKKTTKAIEYKNNIDKLIEFVIVNNKGKKAYVELMNTLTFNKRHITQSTWFQLTNNITPDCSNNVTTPILLDNEDSDSDESSIFIIKDDTSEVVEKKPIINKSLNNMFKKEHDDSENELPEIKIKGETYLLDGNKLYSINGSTKGELCGKFYNGKIIKNIYNV